MSGWFSFVADQESRIQARIRFTPPIQHVSAWQHGTLDGFRRHGCRCLPCRAAYAQHKSEIRQQLRAAEYAARAERRTVLRDLRERAITVKRRHRVTHGVSQRQRSEAWHLKVQQDKRRIALRQELGLCRNCPVALTEDEQRWGYVRCTECRRRHSEQQQQSVARKGRAA